MLMVLFTSCGRNGRAYWFRRNESPAPACNNADLFEATCGGMGFTGVITRVKFRLKKIETSYIKQKQIKAENLEEVIGLFEQYKHYTYSVAWIDCLKKGKQFGRSILMLGEHAEVEDLTSKQKDNPLKLFPEKSKSPSRSTFLPGP